MIVLVATMDGGEMSRLERFQVFGVAVLAGALWPVTLTLIVVSMLMQ